MVLPTSLEGMGVKPNLPTLVPILPDDLTAAATAVIASPAAGLFREGGQKSEDRKAATAAYKERKTLQLLSAAVARSSGSVRRLTSTPFKTGFG
jgi:hypothetical protein